MKPLTAREIALDVLTKVEKEKSYSNLQLNQSLEKANLSRADINFATEIIYGTIQRLNTIDWILSPFLKTNLNKLDLWVKNLLRLSIYQLFYLDRVPTHAIVNEAVNIAKDKGHKGISGMVNGVLRNIIRNKDTIKYPEDMSSSERISLEHSHPLWLVERFVDNYGLETTEAICQVNNLAPFHSIRINPLKISREEMIEKMQEKFGSEVDIKPSILSNQGIRIKGGGNLAHSDWYKNGLFTIQDESSMLVADILDPLPGMVVLDAAAAPGGKTTHIAEKMKDQGEVIASDLHKHKIKLIKQQQNRLGIHIINTLHADARNIKQHYGQTFDRILLDVPCSGLGVIRRKPDLKWSKQEKDIMGLTRVQSEILEEVSPLLKPGGILVYSTCTMALEENQQMVNNFINKHPEFKLDDQIKDLLPAEILEKIDVESGMLQILPHQFHTDGFFISRLIKSK